MKPMGLLQPLLILLMVLKDISMDFMTEHLVVKGQAVIAIFLDRLTKYFLMGCLSGIYPARLVVDSVGS